MTETKKDRYKRTWIRLGMSSLICSAREFVSGLLTWDILVVNKSEHQACPADCLLASSNGRSKAPADLDRAGRASRLNRDCACRGGLRWENRTISIYISILRDRATIAAVALLISAERK